MNADETKQNDVDDYWYYCYYYWCFQCYFEYLLNQFLDGGVDVNGDEDGVDDVYDVNDGLNVVGDDVDYDDEQAEYDDDEFRLHSKMIEVNYDHSREEQYL